MENQHRKISGYRELSQEEIDLMNRIKAKGQELLDLQAELQTYIDGLFIDSDDMQRFDDAEPHKWVRIGKNDIQTGIMALVRAVAQPGSC